ncbi:CDC42 small effector protein 2-A [Eurytemora carolleeae]|uniref:CDC42 small effector protein 2-A n=1 Tax=Eurytemora carolleeae TaxID=1294199 RepID=UPI000C7720B1|nr:CDC42 small effector protein 2-A [Eurytemora carolleeae]|eukprot:XP_023322538.1 CDC42 small effector protein 2-A-like [Eurytemora affinis]
MAGEFWFQLFSCVAEQEQEQTRRRPRIDRSMIGEPMDFRHTGHVGSTDLGCIPSFQSQMSGKGGEQVNLQIRCLIQVPQILNARSIHELQRHSIKA